MRAGHTVILQIILFYFALFDVAHQTILHQDVLGLLMLLLLLLLGTLLLLLVHIAVFLIHGYGPVAPSLLLRQWTLDLTLPRCFTAAPHEGILQHAEASMVAHSGACSDAFLCAAHSQELLIGANLLVIVREVDVVELVVHSFKLFQTRL